MHEPSLGELQRLVLRIETGLREDVSEIRQDIRNLRFVDQGVYDADKRTLAAELQRLRDEQMRMVAEQQKARENTRNLWRVAVTQFLAPIVVAIVLAWVLRGGV